jgi:hypothetical protein
MPNRGQFQRSSSGLKGSKYVLLQLLFSHHSNGNQAFFLKRRVNIFFYIVHQVGQNCPKSELRDLTEEWIRMNNECCDEPIAEYVGVSVHFLF